jgi:hypothetical protein
MTYETQARTMKVLAPDGGPMQFDFGNYKHTRLIIQREDSTLWLGVQYSDFSANQYFAIGAPGAVGPAVMQNLDGLTGFMYCMSQADGNTNYFSVLQWN